jgi:AraC family transcriptional regulator
MSTTTDTFSRFVDVLAETLDDHAATGDELAARMHLSRFHFDRLVSAAAGEPPAALRRRILLERAAYRLLTTDADVLAVALDAGYASHEAFTRAFRRAYGTSPSRWRRESNRFEIDAPSKVHFSPPGGLRVPADGKVGSMDLLVRMVEHHVWLVGELVDRADGLGDKVLDAPIEISVDGIDSDPTLRSLLSRLVGQLAMWEASMHSEPYDFAAEAGMSIAEIRTRLDEIGPIFLGDVKELVAGGRIDETFVDATCDPPYVCTYGGMIAHVLTFAAHRRTLVCGALMDAGITDLGSGDPLRFVADAA